MEIALRITVLGPLVEPLRDDGDSISFDVEIRVETRDGNAAPHFLGPFAQGTPASRVVYVNSRKQAGQRESRWDRRAKVLLAGVTWAVIDQGLATPHSIIEARISGTGRDGGPACATVPLVSAWQVIPS